MSNLKKKALITGISGQDGSYLAEFLLDKGYEVHGLIRRHSVAENQTVRIEKNRQRLNLHYGDLTDIISLQKIFTKHIFDEVYNLGAQSNVGISFSMPEYTQQVNYIGFINILECIRNNDIENKTKVYQASSSEMFGNECENNGTQNEDTPMIPVSPYGISKLSAHRYAQHYRRAYGMWISCGILFNHESPRRGSNFVTGKICKAVANISLKRQKKLELGNLESSRDWGHSEDYVKVMYQMLNEAKKPDDFVCCTGITHTVRDFCYKAFSMVELDYRDYVVYDSKHLRDEELSYLKGDNRYLMSEINVELKWNLDSMIKQMIEYHKKRSIGIDTNDYFEALDNYL